MPDFLGRVNVADLTAVAGSVTTETARATAAEGVLTTSVATEASTRAAA